MDAAWIKNPGNGANHESLHDEVAEVGAIWHVQVEHALLLWTQQLCGQSIEVRTRLDIGSTVFEVSAHWVI